MQERLKIIREYFGMTQSEFAKKLGIGQSTLAMMEVSKRDISDRHIKTICAICNVDENWLRTGEGEMFNESDEFSLDEYAQQHDMSEMDLKIIKGFLDLDPEVRKIIVSTFGNALSEDRAEAKEKANKVVEVIDENKDKAGTKPYRLKKASTPIEEIMVAEGSIEYPADSIDAELESYRRELEAERQNETSSALPRPGENIG